MPARNDPGRRPRFRASGLLAVLVLPALAGCLNGGTLLAVASAPKEGGGLTILVGGTGLDPDGQATFVILKDGRLIYPPGGIGGAIHVAGGQGSVFVPYSVFVVGNGLYDVQVAYDGKTRTTTVPIEKWVEYVFLHPVLKGGNVQVDVQLSKAQGGLPTDRIIAEGQLILEIFYRGIDGKSREPVRTISQKTPPDETFARVLVPKTALNRGPGYYAFEATFHNEQAFGNNGVGNDPSMAQRSPPWNWICIDAACT